jgi:hypothetical protein
MVKEKEKVMTRDIQFSNMNWAKILKKIPKKMPKKVKKNRELSAVLVGHLGLGVLTFSLIKLASISMLALVSGNFTDQPPILPCSSWPVHWRTLCVCQEEQGSIGGCSVKLPETMAAF